MNKGLTWALGILALTVVVLIFNKGSVNVNVVFTDFSAMKSMVFLGFMSIGVIIGVLLK